MSVKWRDVLEVTTSMLPWPFFFPYQRLERLARVLVKGEDVIEEQISAASESLVHAAEVITELQRVLETQR